MSWRKDELEHIALQTRLPIRDKTVQRPGTSVLEVQLIAKSALEDGGRLVDKDSE